MREAEVPLVHDPAPHAALPLADADVTDRVVRIQQSDLPQKRTNLVLRPADLGDFALAQQQRNLFRETVEILLGLLAIHGIQQPLELIDVQMRGLHFLVYFFLMVAAVVVQLDMK